MTDSGLTLKWILCHSPLKSFSETLLRTGEMEEGEEEEEEEGEEEEQEKVEEQEGALEEEKHGVPCGKVGKEGEKEAKKEVGKKKERGVGR